MACESGLHPWVSILTQFPLSHFRGFLFRRVIEGFEGCKYEEGENFKEGGDFTHL